MESLKGSSTAVFGASMWNDYQTLYSKDIDTLPRMAVSGTAPSILPNRLSWYFDLRGPSIHIDTACSSSMVAMDLACQSLWNGSATAVSAFLSQPLISLVSSDECAHASVGTCSRHEPTPYSRELDIPLQHGLPVPGQFMLQLRFSSQRVR